MPHHAGSSSAAIKLKKPPWLQEPPGEGTHLATGLRVPPGGWGGMGGVLELQHQPASLHLSILGEREGAEQRQGQGESRRGGAQGRHPHIPHLALPAPSPLAPEGLWGSTARCPPLAHLHARVGCFRRCLLCIVDEGATSFRQHPDEADLPKPAEWSARDAPCVSLAGVVPQARSTREQGQARGWQGTRILAPG